MDKKKPSDPQVDEMLEAIKDYQEGYVMTEEEARALNSSSPPQQPLIPVKSLPVRNKED